MKPIYRYNMSIAQLFPVKEGRAMLTSIGTRKNFRKHGDAQKVLELVLSDADTENVILVLAVAPDPDTNFDRLVNWYKRNGFTFVTDDDSAMIRFPRKESE